MVALVFQSFGCLWHRLNARIWRGKVRYCPRQYFFAWQFKVGHKAVIQNFAIIDPEYSRIDHERLDVFKNYWVARLVIAVCFSIFFPCFSHSPPPFRGFPARHGLTRSRGTVVRWSRFLSVAPSTWSRSGMSATQGPCPGRFVPVHPVSSDGTRWFCHWKMDGKWMEQGFHHNFIHPFSENPPDLIIRCF